jgi:hypothetical protein
MLHWLVLVGINCWIVSTLGHCFHGDLLGDSCMDVVIFAFCFRWLLSPESTFTCTWWIVVLWSTCVSMNSFFLGWKIAKRWHSILWMEYFVTNSPFFNKKTHVKGTENCVFVEGVVTFLSTGCSFLNSSN